MSEEISGRVKRKQKAKSKSPAVLPLYAVMHETNVALCLASGFLTPRLEESAARDHHRAAGKIVLEQSKPSALSICQARGDLAYGTVVVVELYPERLSGTGAVDTEMMPLSVVKRLLFENEQSRLEFMARTSAYADIPRDLLPCEIDAAMFEFQEEPSDSPIEQARLIEAVPDDRLRAQITLLDRCAGGLAASLSTLNAPEAIELYPALAGFGEGVLPVSSPSQIAWELATRIDASVDAESYEPLLTSIVSALCEVDVADGFSASSLLKKLHAAFDMAEGAATNDAVMRFIKFAQDVVALRRDIPQAAFADIAGSAVPRGALLFLLNPDPETLAAVRVRTLGLGPRVYFIAALLVGIRSGMARLPSGIKANRSSFLAIPSFVLATLRGDVPPCIVNNHWERSGEKVSELAWNGYSLAQALLPTDAAQKAHQQIAIRAGIVAAFSSDGGALMADISKDGRVAELTLRSGMASTFPKTAVVEVILRIACSLQKRAAMMLLVSTNEQAKVTGIHGGIVETGRGRAVELSAYLIEPASSDALVAAQEALWAEAARWHSKPEPEPTTPALFPLGEGG